jgi:uncharacterized membrane protein YczE
MKEYLKKISWKKIVLVFLGVVLIGIGTTFLRFAGFGTDPFSCMNIGVSSHLPISYGTYQLLLNVVMFIPVIILYPRSFGIGAFINMLGLAYVIDFCVWLCGLAGFTVEGVSDYLIVRVLLLLIGILIFCFGVALYMECDLGIAAYDCIGQIAEQRTNGKLKFKWVRVFTDFLCMAIGFFSGGTLGVATFVVAFLTGPVVSWFREHAAKKIVKD